MGRLDRGDDLEEGLLRVCSESSIRCGEIRLIGALSHAELCAYDQKKQAYGPSRKISGNLEILSILGNVSEKSGDRAIHLHATLARDTDNGIQVIGGHLLSAKVFACEYAIHTCEDLILRRSRDEKTGLPLWNEKIQFPPIPPEPVSAAPGPSDDEPSAEHETGSSDDSRNVHPEETKTPQRVNTRKLGSGARKSSVDSDNVSWDDVLAASTKRSKETPGVSPAAVETDENQDQDYEDSPERQSSDDYFAEDPITDENTAEDEESWETTVEPQPGDIVIHPQFGECKVERLEDGEFLHVRLESGRSIRLNMDILNLHLSGFEEGRQIFETRIGR